MDDFRLLGWIDPDFDWLGGRFGPFADEAFWIDTKGAIKGFLSGDMNGVGLSVMDLIRGHQADPGVIVVLVVPSEEIVALWRNCHQGLAVRPN